MHNFFIKSIAFFSLFRALPCNRFNKGIEHQVGKQDCILLRCRSTIH